ncbi:MAG: family 2 glycosyl transferase [Cyclobacteriaceae bacterium]
MKENIYLKRYAYPTGYFDLGSLAGSDMLVVIPCFDEPNLVETLDSLNRSTVPRDGQVGVMVVINHGTKSSDEIKARNRATLAQFQSWAGDNTHTSISYQCRLVELPQKHAGVGLARKVGMDDAVRIFDLSGKDGPIVCLDADCTVYSNYFEALWDAFNDTKVKSASLYYEHSVDLSRGDDNPEGIVLYEIYLRYYIDALRYAGYPMAVQTIGSSMAVRCSAYQKCGGMNRRKAGEDFYFIHKLLPLGGYTEINSTTVRPSGRVSDRVPFGTGAAIGKWTEDASSLDLICNPDIFEDLKTFVDATDHFYRLSESEITDLIEVLPISIRRFLEIGNGVKNVLEIKAKTSNASSFKKQFWNYFDGLKVLKYVHYASEHNSPRVPVSKGLAWIFAEHFQIDKPATLVESLKALREFDRTNAVRIDL